MTQSGLNSMKTVAEQAPKLVARHGRGHEAIGEMVDSITDMLGAPFTVVAGLIGLAALHVRLRRGRWQQPGGDHAAHAGPVAGRASGAGPQDVLARRAQEGPDGLCGGVVLVVVVYAHDIWDSKFNLLKYPASWLGFKGIPEIPDKYMWVISMLYGGATVGLHAIYKKTQTR